MDYSQHIFVLMSLTSIITSNTATLTPSGSTVSVDCGSQQTFTCSVTGVGAGWTIAGLDGITASGTNGLALASSSSRVTTTDISGLVQTSTITITGFTTSDNGGSVQCINQADSAVQGMATVSVGVPSCSTNVLVADRRSDFSSATITWDQPANSPPVTSYDVTCNSSCTAMPCSSGSSTCRVLSVSPCEDYSVTVLPMNSCGSSTGCTENVVAVPSQGPPRCGVVGVYYGNDSCPAYTFTPPQGSPQPSTVVVSYQLVGDPSSAGSLNCAYPIDPQMCELIVPGGTYNVRLTPQNSCGSPSVCPTFIEAIPDDCRRTLVSRLPAAATIASSTVSILSGVVPSVALILINIISVVVVFLVTRHCYKKSTKGGSSSRQEELYAQVEGKKVYEDINMTDSPAYGPTSSQNQ